MEVQVLSVRKTAGWSKQRNLGQHKGAVFNLCISSWACMDCGHCKNWLGGSILTYDWSPRPDTCENPTSLAWERCIFSAIIWHFWTPLWVNFGGDRTLQREFPLETPLLGWETGQWWAHQFWIWIIHMRANRSHRQGYLWAFNPWCVLKSRGPFDLAIAFLCPHVRFSQITDSLCRRHADQASPFGFPNGLAWAALKDYLFFSFWEFNFFTQTSVPLTLAQTCLPFSRIPTTGETSSQPAKKGALGCEHFRFEYQCSRPPPLTREYWQSR